MRDIKKFDITSDEWPHGADLELCLVQTPPPCHELLDRDASRPSSLAISRAVLATISVPTLVVFPELAFGTCDFQALDELVRGMESPAIVLAGFGWARAAALKDQVTEFGLERGWNPHRDPHPNSGRVNGGWCWVHPGQGNADRRFVFLKNFQEQNVEILSCPDLQPAHDILRLKFPSFLLFPLICADLVEANDRSARDRVAREFPEDEGCQRALVVGLLYADRTGSSHWHSALQLLCALPRAQVLVALANQGVEPHAADEQVDRHRGLSGVFCSTESYEPPRGAHRWVRNLTLDGASGVVLRRPGPGWARGPLHWRQGVNRGRLWLPNERRLWDGQPRPCLVPEGAYELGRFVRRHREHLLSPYRSCEHRRAEAHMAIALDELERRLMEASTEAESRWLSALWPQLIRGLEKNDAAEPVDALHQTVPALVAALRALAALHQASAARLPESPPPRGQLSRVVPEAHVAVWRDPAADHDRVYDQVAAYARESGSDPPLYVVGGGDGGEAPAAQRVTDRARLQGEFTEPRPEGDAGWADAKSKVVFWRPLGPIHRRTVADLEQEEWAKGICEELALESGDDE